MTTKQPAPSAAVERALLWGSVGVASGYWLLWVLACPVVNADSLSFNLARLWVLERGGLLHNTACTWDRFLTAPLAFDATHYLFLYLGHAYELPSFLCFVGLLAAAYHLLQGRFGRNSGLLACAGLLGMPSLVYQAVNTKNDLVVAFGLMTWFYALDRARRTEERAGRLHLVMAALALGLIMGSKASGLAFGLMAGVVSLVTLHGPQRKAQITVFAAALMISALLFSDWEISVVNHWRFGHWLGDPGDVNTVRNLDGPRGVAANLLRYAAELSDPFLVNAPWRVTLMQWRKDGAEGCIQHLGLAGAGMMHMPWRPFREENFDVASALVYTETNATYGLLGALVLWGTLPGLLRRRWDLAAQLFTVAAVSFALVVCTVGWSPANLRYMVAPFTFGLTGLVAWLCTTDRAWMRTAFTAVALTSVYLTMAFAVSKPMDLLPTVLRLPGAMLGPQQRALVPPLDALAAAGPLPVLLYAAPRTELFDVYDRLRGNVIVVTALDAATFAQVENRYHHGRYVVLVMNRDIPPAAGLQIMRPIPRARRATADSGFFLWTAPPTPGNE